MPIRWTRPPFEARTAVVATKKKIGARDGSVSDEANLTAYPTAKTLEARQARRRRLRRYFIGIYILFLLILGELGARAYWTTVEKVPFTRTGNIWYRFWPEMRDSGADQRQIQRDDATYDVLLLGGSVIHHDFGDIGENLEKQLAQALDRPVKVYNLGNVARTTRDSYWKYKSLTWQKFDRVVVYHGINDSRMNNCPETMFRDDYSHCSWYHWIKKLKKHREVAWTALPYTVDYLVIDALDGLKMGFYVPRHGPRESWLDEGAQVKTERTFRKNMEGIAALSRQRGDKLTVCTFATYLPVNYTEELFNAHALDYAAHSLPVSIWGKPANVVRAVDIHNQQIRAMVERHPEITLVDMESAIPDAGKYYNDICHLAQPGCDRFVETLVQAMMREEHQQLAARGH